MKTLITLCLLLCLSAPHVQAQLVTGADFSWLTEQEAEGITFSDSNGNSRDCMQLLKGNGINAARFRVWVNPTDNWCNADDVTEKAQRASREGMKIMIDFHYSDSWADPSKQFTPEAWTDYDIHELCTAVYNHTRDVLGQLKAEGIVVDWVQVGNETRGGMLYPLGKIENGENFAWLINSGHDAVKSVFPDAKVIVHVDNGWDAGLFDYVFDYLTEHQTRYNLIGMSLYPVNTYDSQSADYFRTSQWKEKADLCLQNIRRVAEKYGKNAIICETGVPNAYTTETLADSQTWEQRCSDDAFDYYTYMLAELARTPQCEGIFYWEPQCYGNWKAYPMGAFLSNGSPNGIFDALRNFHDQSGIRQISTEPDCCLRLSEKKLCITVKAAVTSVTVYALSGTPLLQTRPDTCECSLDLSSFSAGLYLLTVSTPSRTFSQLLAI